MRLEGKGSLGTEVRAPSAKPGMKAGQSGACQAAVIPQPASRWEQDLMSKTKLAPQLFHCVRLSLQSQGTVEKALLGLVDAPC